MRYVEFATHNLVEGRLVGTIADAYSALDEAERYARAAVDPGPLRDLVSQIGVYRQLLTDWHEWKSEAKGAFPDWCRERGRPYSWPTIVYYDR